MHKYCGYLCAVLTVTCVMLPTCLGQASASRGGGPLDSDVPVPQQASALGPEDASALAAITAHLKVVGTSPWTGMQGTGQITYGSSDEATYAATLSILGASGFRLDSQTARGQTSMRIYNKLGKIHRCEGSNHVAPPANCCVGNRAV